MKNKIQSYEVALISWIINRYEKQIKDNILKSIWTVCCIKRVSLIQ